MNLLTYQSELKKIIAQRNGYLVLAAGSLCLSILLLLLIFSLVGREKIILMTPSMSKESWVNSTEASPDYLSKMTLFLSELILNVTAENVDFQREMLLRYVDPAYYGFLKTQLVAEADRIKQQHISTVFFPVDIKVDSKHFAVILTGDLKSYVGETVLPTKRISYRINYRFHSYSPLLQRFEEVKHV